MKAKRLVTVPTILGLLAGLAVGAVGAVASSTAAAAPIAWPNCKVNDRGTRCFRCKKDCNCRCIVIKT